MRESQGAKLSCCTLRSSAMAGFDVRVSHPAIYFLIIFGETEPEGEVDGNIWVEGRGSSVEMLSLVEGEF